MSKFMTALKQLFCFHEFSFFDLMCASTSIEYSCRCTKCDKFVRIK